MTVPPRQRRHQRQLADMHSILWVLLVMAVIYLVGCTDGKVIFDVETITDNGENSYNGWVGTTEAATSIQNCGNFIGKVLGGYNKLGHTDVISKEYTLSGSHSLLRVQARVVKLDHKW